MPEGMLGLLSLSEVRGPRDDLEDKLAGSEGLMWLCALKKMLRKESLWRAPMILGVTSNGRTGRQFFASLEDQGYRVSDYAMELLRSPEFVPTSSKLYKIIVIMPDEFKDEERTNTNIRAKAESYRCIDPPAELAPLLREVFSDEDIEAMGLFSLIVMHKPIHGDRGRSGLLGIDRHTMGRYLYSFISRSDHKCSREEGFVFLAPTS